MPLYVEERQHCQDPARVHRVEVAADDPRAVGDAEKVHGWRQLCDAAFAVDASVEVDIHHAYRSARRRDRRGESDPAPRSEGQAMVREGMDAHILQCVPADNRQPLRCPVLVEIRRRVSEAKSETTAERSTQDLAIDIVIIIAHLLEQQDVDGPLVVQSSRTSAVRTSAAMFRLATVKVSSSVG